MTEIKQKILNLLPDWIYIQKQFHDTRGVWCHLNKPQTFDEKLQWLKLHNRNPLYTSLVDKYEVKKWVAERIGDEYVIPTYGVWDRFDDIDFETLPESFILKCTHDSGSTVIVQNKEEMDTDRIREKLETCLNHNFYYNHREWPYKNVRPRIMAEALIETPGGSGPLNDYKFFCFSGKMKYTDVCTERFSSSGLKITFFDRDWNRMPFTRTYPSSEKDIPKPENYGQMISLAETLADGIGPFVRVDLYDTGERIYFGEMTFFPGSALGHFEPEEWNKKLGDLINLNEISGKQQRSN